MDASMSPVGVMGAGSFGTAVANLLAQHADVMLFSRKEETVEAINTSHRHLEQNLSPRIRATDDPQELAERCSLLFPIVPSTAFRSTMQMLSPFLRPYHIVIHGTKGFDLMGLKESDLDHSDVVLTRANVRTMSEVIGEESCVVRVGCLSGPNLALEILAGQPAATVVASRFKEVIKAGQTALNSPNFHVFGSSDLLGAELAGALKNIVALGSGILGGLGLGRNIQGLLIARGLAEMVYFGNAMGADSKAFMGVAGIGDLVATATSTNSRNYSFGMRIAKGESASEIRESMTELAEGVRTLRIAHQLARHLKLRAPITDTLHAVVFEDLPVQRALEYLMGYPYAVDVDFL
ncbi:MAG: NAD(P)H-dependent glycerol-3-phosphate dehydrogenase [Saprospiraceae bacterium]